MIIIIIAIIITSSSNFDSSQNYTRLKARAILRTARITRIH